MDATGTDARGPRRALCATASGARSEFAADQPERVAGIVAFAPGVPLLAPAAPVAIRQGVQRTSCQTYEGWAKENRHYWRRDYPGFAQFFFERDHDRAALDQADRGRRRVGGRGIGRGDDRRRATSTCRRLDARRRSRRLCRAVRCPMLHRPWHGGPLPADRAVAPARRAHRRAPRRGRGRRPHDPRPAPGPCQPADPRLRPIPHRGDGPGSRHRPAIEPDDPRTWTRALARRRRALYISSPIGLGHAQRDVAIAAELRKLRPDLEIDWLAQQPVTDVLEAHGERIHPLSAELASESAHITAESSEHDLNAFQAIRRMDEILVANFMVFHDAVEGGEYDLVIGDEAWDVDHFLHENPELKRTAFAWMTDFVGWLPMPVGRRSRGVPDRRLQRGDDRARRAIPADPRPGDLRGRTR